MGTVEIPEEIINDIIKASANIIMPVSYPERTDNEKTFNNEFYIKAMDTDIDVEFILIPCKYNKILRLYKESHFDKDDDGPMFFRIFFLSNLIYPSILLLILKGRRAC